jgi:ribosomal-protein-alanine N-acetyltransferase
MPSYNGGVKFLLRDYRPGDVDSLWRIDQECFEAGIAYSMEEMLAYLGQKGAFALVAEQLRGGDATGFVIGQAVARGQGRASFGYVITIDVLAEGRRSGLGSLLLGAAESRMRRAGCRKVVLEAAVDNAAALAFYKRHGYSVVATHPGYYLDGKDAYEMEKAL